MKLTKQAVEALRPEFPDLCDDHKAMRAMLEDLLRYIGTTCQCQPDREWRCMSCKLKELLV